jgi:hypothetical protein
LQEIWLNLFGIESLDSRELFASISRFSNLVVKAPPGFLQNRLEQKLFETLGQCEVVKTATLNSKNLEKSTGTKKRIFFVREIESNVVGLDHRDTCFLHLQPLQLATVSKVVGDLNLRVVATKALTAEELLNESLGLPFVVYQYINQILTRGTQEFEDRLETCWQQYYNLLRAEFALDWAPFEYALKVSVSEKIEEKFLQLARSGFELGQFKNIKKRLLPSLDWTTKTFVPTPIKPKNLESKTDLLAHEKLEAAYFGWRVSISKAQCNEGLQTLFKLQKHQEILRFTADSENSDDDIKSFWRFQSAFVLARAEIHGGLAERAMKSSLVSPFNVRIILQSHRSKIGAISAREYVKETLILQARFKNDPVTKLILDCEIGRGELLYNFERAELLIKSIGQNPVYKKCLANQSSVFSRILVSRFEYLSGMYRQDLRQYQDADRHFEKCIDAISIEDDVDAFMASFVARAVGPFMSDRMEKAMPLVREFEEKYGQPKTPFLEKFLFMMRILWDLYRGDFESFKITESLFLKNWKALDRRTTALLDVGNFENLCFVKLMNNDFYGAGVLTEEALNAGKLEHRSYRVWGEFFVNLLKSLNILDSRDGSAASLRSFCKEWRQKKYPIWIEAYYNEIFIQNRLLLEHGKWAPFNFDRPDRNIIKGSADLHLVIQAGIRDLILGKVKQARVSVEAAYGVAQEWGNIFVKARCLAALAMIDAHYGNYEQAISRIQAFREIEKEEFPSKLEFRWLPVVEGFCLYKLGSFDDSEKVFRKLSPVAPENVLLDFVSVELGRARPLQRNFSQSDLDFYENIFRVLYPEAARKIVVEGTLGRQAYFPHALPKYSSDDYFLIFDERKSELNINGRVLNLQRKPLQLSLIKYFLEFQNLEHSKFDLATRIWMEEYNPSMHDARIYMAVARLRSFIRRKGVLELSRNGYIFSPAGNWVWIKGRSVDAEYSDRQNWILSFLEHNESITRYAVQKSLKIGPTLAKRELSTLIRRGLVQKVGLAKNTEYQKKRT